MRWEHIIDLKKLIQILNITKYTPLLLIQILRIKVLLQAHLILGALHRYEIFFLTNRNFQFNIKCYYICVYKLNKYSKNHSIQSKILYFTGKKRIRTKSNPHSVEIRTVSLVFLTFRFALTFIIFKSNKKGDVKTITVKVINDCRLYFFVLEYQNSDYPFQLVRSLDR